MRIPGPVGESGGDYERFPPLGRPNVSIMNLKKLGARWLAVILTLLAWSPRIEAAIPPAENLLPADTFFLFTVPDCAALRKTLGESPVASRKRAESGTVRRKNVSAGRRFSAGGMAAPRREVREIPASPKASQTKASFLKFIMETIGRRNGPNRSARPADSLPTWVAQLIYRAIF